MSTMLATFNPRHGAALVLLLTAMTACGGSAPPAASGDSSPELGATTTTPADSMASAGRGGAAAAGSVAASNARTSMQPSAAGAGPVGRSDAQAAGDSGHAGASGSQAKGAVEAGSGASANAGTAGTVAAPSSAGAGTSGSAAGPTGRAPLASVMYPTTTEKLMDPPVFHLTRPMDLKQPGDLLPVIVWANGGCVTSDFTWMALFERWASAGFAVLSLTNSGSDDDIASMLGMSTKTEHAALIDWVTKANQSGPYAGMLDLKRIVVAGNSCGGVTALQVAAEDTRLAAVFVLSGSSAIGSVDTAIMQKISIPVGYITGSPSEDVAAPNAAGDYDALKEGVPAMLVNRKTGDHQTVSTDEKILPEDAEIALNWMDLALYGTRAAHVTLMSPNVCEHCTPGDWMLKAKNLEQLIK